MDDDVLPKRTWQLEGRWDKWRRERSMLWWADCWKRDTGRAGANNHRRGEGRGSRENGMEWYRKNQRSGRNRPHQ